MDHKQIEGKLQEAYRAGFREGAAGASDNVREITEQKWRHAVEATLEETKGIGPGRKELFLERLNRKMKGRQEPKKLQ